MPRSDIKMGWLPDLPDFRDYTEQTNTIHGLLKKVGVADPVSSTLPASVDLRQWCSPIEDQKSLGSCTANAGVALVEYFQRRAFGKHIDASRLFLYKVTRNLLGWTGDTGAFLRDTMKALVLFGVPPEKNWPYIIEDFEKEPTAFCYAFAQNYQAIQYYRLDPPGSTPDDIMNRLWANLAGGLPAMFGFTVYSSIYDHDVQNTGCIPFPAATEGIEGGHAVCAVGYDDDKVITNPNNNESTTGAFLIRNSWGTGWGESGYGWLPYEYVYKGLADDWWSLLDNEWIDTGEFSV